MASVLLAVLAGLAVSQVAIVLTTVYLHRALAHRSMTLSRGTAAVCRVLLWITVGIRPRQWVAVHRKHHAYTDVEGDPHSPVLLGYARVQLTNVALYRKVARNEAQVARYARDIPADLWDRLLFDHALVGLSIGMSLLWVILGSWQLMLIAVGVNTVVYLVLSGAINAVGHTWGSQPYDNTATNNQWLAWLTAGEGLHNNHHAAPTSARFDLDESESDPGWWVVRALLRLHLAKVRHSALKPKSQRRTPADTLA